MLDLSFPDQGSNLHPLHWKPGVLAAGGGGLVTQLCPTLRPHGLPDSSVHWILQARILEWVAISYSKGSFPLGDWTHVSCTGRQVLYHWATWEARLIKH